MNSRKIIFIAGSTAVGKTDIALELARQLNGEIISCDSMQVYKQISIVNNKPPTGVLKEIRHHLIDVVNPNETFSVAEFKHLAEKCIQDIHTRGKVPIVVGATGLYIDALLYNFQFQDKPNEAYRTQLLQMNDEELTTLLHTKNIDVQRF